MTTNNIRRSRSFAPKAKNETPLFIELLDKEYEAHSDIPGATILEFAAASESGSSAGVLMEFLEKAIKPKDFAELKKVLNDPEVSIPVETIGEIVSYLIEQYTGDRPLEV